MVSDAADEESDVRVSRKMELVRTAETSGNAMIGITYLTAQDGASVSERIHQLCGKPALPETFQLLLLWHQTSIVPNDYLSPSIAHMY